MNALPASPPPRRFGAYVRRRRATGILTIAPGEIAFRLDRLFRRTTDVEEVVQTSPDVVVVYARLRHAVVIWLEGRDANAAVSAGFSLSRVVRELRDAGFRPHLQRRWLWMGATGPP
ncbi:MAG TPA: hypothetical protein VFA43_14530 [Gemmatimonadaceae bacterium]|nr:hypothetical protein [Gemmatimonadaceae bacterium]